ncbi:hypothetical protein MMC30_002959 [Trapelia coarctata]|nr:hypothetical protein [Trapelia coarctata]
MQPTPTKPVVLAYYGPEYFPTTKYEWNDLEPGEVTIYHRQDFHCGYTFYPSRRKDKLEKCQPFEDSTTVNGLVRQLKGDSQRDYLRVWRGMRKTSGWRWLLEKELGTRFGSGERTLREEGLGLGQPVALESNAGFPWEMSV